MVGVVTWSIIVAITVSIEITLIYWLCIKQKVEGDTTGIFIMFIDGIIGTICLLITTL